MSVKGVQGQASSVKNALPGAVNKYKAWAKKEKGEDFVKEIDVSFDEKNPIKTAYACPRCDTKPPPNARS